MMPVIYPNYEWKRLPLGERVNVRDLFKDANIPIRLTTHHWPEVYVHEGEESFRIFNPFNQYDKKYCIGTKDMPTSIQLRALYIINRMAFQFHDWVAKETWATHRRFLKRSVWRFLGKYDVSELEARIMSHIADVRLSFVDNMVQSLKISESDVRKSLIRLKEKKLVYETPNCKDDYVLDYEGKKILYGEVEVMLELGLH